MGAGLSQLALQPVIRRRARQRAPGTATPPHQAGRRGAPEKPRQDEPDPQGQPAGVLGRGAAELLLLLGIALAEAHEGVEAGHSVAGTQHRLHAIHGAGPRMLASCANRVPDARPGDEGSGAYACYHDARTAPADRGGAVNLAEDFVAVVAGSQPEGHGPRLITHARSVKADARMSGPGDPDKRPDHVSLLAV